MRIFNKADKFNVNAARGELLRRLDTLNDKIYRQSGASCGDKFYEVRSKLQRADLDSEVCAALHDAMDRFENMQFNAAFGVELLFRRMEKIMFFKKKKSNEQSKHSSEELKYDELLEKIETVTLEIKECESEIAALDKKIKYCLEHRLKADWEIATTEKTIKQNILISKLDSLKTLLALRSNMSATLTTRDMRDLNEMVSSAMAYVDVAEMKEISENYHAVAEQVKEDKSEIDEIFLGNKAMDDDFDAAYEKYIAESGDTDVAENTEGGKIKI